MENMGKNWTRCMPIAQYVACSKLNLVDGPETLKKSNWHFAVFPKVNTHNG